MGKRQELLDFVEDLRGAGVLEYVGAVELGGVLHDVSLKLAPAEAKSAHVELAPAPKKKPKQPVAPILSPEARAEAEREQRLRELTGGL